MNVPSPSSLSASFDVGGTLIAPGYVLSAAHCHGFNPKVVIGTNDLSDQSGSSVEVHEVEYEVVHPDYDCITIQDDVMVLKLATNSSYTPVSYDKGSTSYSPGTNVTVVGWGKISDEGPLSDVLLEASVEIQENSVCAEPYSEYDHVVTDDSKFIFNGSRVVSCIQYINLTLSTFFKHILNNDKVLCAYHETKGFCSGDSGGPLLIKEGGNHTQIGIVSHSFYECENPDYADVYMKTSSYADFIECVTNGGSDECGDVCDCSEKNLKNTMEVGLLKNLILTVMKTSNY